MLNKKLVRSHASGCFFLLLSILCFSCASHPDFEGYGDLCGMIIDEKNQPVDNFVVYYSKAPFLNKSTVTNESGIFVFHNVPSGQSVISGEKKNFSRLKDSDYYFCDRSDIICFQVNSIKAVINEVDPLIKAGDKKKAYMLLDNVSCEEASEEWILIESYKFFLTESQDKKKKIINSIKKNTGDEDTFYSNYLNKLEEFLND